MASKRVKRGAQLWHVKLVTEKDCLPVETEDGVAGARDGEFCVVSKCNVSSLTLSVAVERGVIPKHGVGGASIYPRSIHLCP